MSKVTVEMVAELATKRDEIKSKIEQAKGKLSAIEAQVEKQRELLAKYGVTPETAEQRITELDEEISKVYEEAKTLLEGLEDDQREQSENV